MGPSAVAGSAAHGAIVVLTAVSAPSPLPTARPRAWAAYPLALVALLWIAPFYGFFSTPLFLGVSLNAMCPGRPLVTVVLAALGMRAGEQVGLAAASWISGVPPGGNA